MNKNILEERRVGLEEAFFAKQNQELRRRLHEKAARETALEELEQATGINDEDLLSTLVDLGIAADTLAALGLVPLVLVAWADGRIDAPERAALLEAAEDSGIGSGTPSFELLEG